MSGTTRSEEQRHRIRARAGDRCEYCLSPQHLVYGTLHIEHIQPSSSDGSDGDENLCLACSLCNGFKATQTHAIDPVTGTTVHLYNPRIHQWLHHFAWSDDGTRVVGISPCGRATVLALKLNNLTSITVRREWVSVGWHPPQSHGRASFYEGRT
jgi:hypothetical protein